MTLAVRALAFAAAAASANALMPWQDWTLPVEERAWDLVNRLTLEEQINQTWSIAPAIPRFNLSAYNYRSNCVHGWAASGGSWLQNETWTNFPTPLGLGATWDRDLIRAANAVTAREGRALHNLGIWRNGGDSTEARGLNCFAPNVNILRSSLWGRNQEVLSEDPYHLGELAKAFVKGLQVGEAPQYLTVAGCAKHYAIHDGPEGGSPISGSTRETVIANVSAQTAWDAYLGQFRATVVDAQVASVMCAYSASNLIGSEALTDNAPDCANTWLLGTVLRGAMGFGDRQVITDNGALDMEYATHKWAPNATVAAAKSIAAGADNDLGHDGVYPYYLQDAVNSGMINASQVALAAYRNLKMRMRLGDFDPSWLVPYQSYGAEQLDTPAHRAMNLQAAREGLVLLKNGPFGGSKPVLPLAGPGIKKIAVVGPTAADCNNLLGNYQGIPGQCIDAVTGFKNVVPQGVSIVNASGCGAAVGAQLCPSTSSFSDALAAASGADAIVAVVGMSQEVAREGQDWVPTKCQGAEIPVGGLPGCQQPLLQALRTAYPTKPLIVVLVTGNPLTVPYVDANADAIIVSHYPGAAGGQAIAEGVLGLVNPGGRLPYTVPANVTAQQPLTDYSFQSGVGRTYRYQQPSVWQYPFGKGLSYTTFAYGNLSLSAPSVVACEAPLTLNATLTNTGSVDGDEVVQVYVQYSAGGPLPSGVTVVPRYSLRQFARLTLPAGYSTTVSLELPADAFTVVDDAGYRQVLTGAWTVTLGGQQPGVASNAMWTSGQEPLVGTVTVTAPATPSGAAYPFLNCPGATQ